MLESGLPKTETNYTRIQQHAHDATITIAALIMTKLLIRTEFIVFLFVIHKMSFMKNTTNFFHAQDKPQNVRQRSQNSHL